MVFGHTAPMDRDVDDLTTTVRGVDKRLDRAEGGNKELRHVAEQGDTHRCTYEFTCSYADHL